MAQSSAPKPGGAYFEKKGEVHELRTLLRSAAADRDQQKKRDAIKKVIAYMTLGIDVSPLFSEMVMASATNDLVQKKMVYLYLVNYSESNSDLAILAVNTLQKDCRDDDPMVRGLALRSLCSLNLFNMVEYLQPAVMHALQDVNGYVRKTAVLGAVKLHNLSKSAVMDSDVLPRMRALIYDQDAHVVTNTIYAIEEVLVEEGGLTPTRELATGLLNKINQFSEWGQCAVLKILMKYRVADEGEMFDIMNILDGLLKQSSSAVVLAVTKIFMDLTSTRPELQTDVLRRLMGPLLTLMAAATPELAYTVLAHIQAICMRGSHTVEVFSPEFKQFFCRYNEPSYIKSVKIDLLTLLADPNSAEAIVGELSEYVTDVDADISRRAIRAIGRIAIHVPQTAELIVGSLTDLLELDIDYVSTEAAVQMKDLVRKYPDQFQRASGAVERCMKIVTEPEGKCAVLWILGEYGLLIEDAPYILEPMIDGFLEEPSIPVRLEMITAAVKLFFCRPPETQRMLGRLMGKAIQESTCPDVRDRAMLYYRLLEQSPEEARRVICAPKEVVEEFQEEMDAEIKDRIFEEFNTLSTVLKQPAAKFVLSKDPAHLTVYKMEPPPFVGEVPRDDGKVDDFVDMGDRTVSAPAPSPPKASPPPAATGDLLDGFDVLGDPTPPLAAPAPAQQSSAQNSDLLGFDLLGGGDFMGEVAAATPPPQAFQLAQGAVMDGASFQAKWGQLAQQPPQQKQMRMGVANLTTAAVEDLLRRNGVYVLASGMVPPTNTMKFFFFAKQASGPAAACPGTDVWFLFELIMVPGGTAQVTLKTDNAQAMSIERFFALLWESLETFVVR